jgi:putative colanic acid biosysnthesis UDP-glucose lipid carrier transferase
VALAPVMAAVAIAIRLESPGSIIFRQRRYGLDGRDIVVYKFRSMTVTEDGDKQYKQVTVGDSRVTRVGRLIRATSLDELPQFVNVLQGRMSIVGPRPHAVAVNEHYRKLISGYMIRHKVRPGITGWAQVNGYRGGDDINQMRKRIEFDLEYLRSWTLRLDVYILLRTVLLVFRDAKAY